MLADIAEELENGRGAVRLRGLDASRFTEDELRQVFWGIGCHLGTPLFQNAQAARSWARCATNPASPRRPTSRSNRARWRRRARARAAPARCAGTPTAATSSPCYARATRRAGGVSKLASIVTIYNEIGRRRPDLLRLLCQDYWRSRPKDEDGAGAERVFALPVFSVLAAS